MTWAIAQTAGSPAKKAVLMNLADRADEAWSCFPSQRRIALDTELGERTVRRALDELAEAGLLRKEHRRRKGGSYSSDRFVLAGIDTDPDAESLLADDPTSGQSGRRPERPPVGTAAGPAATAAGHEPPGSNHHSTTPLPSGGAPAAEPVDQLPLADIPAAGGKVRRGKTQIPADWTPSPALRAWTGETAPGIPESEIEAFIDRHRSQGATFADHDAAWRTWVRNWVRFQARGRGRGGQQPYRDTGRQHHAQQQIGTTGPPASDGWDGYMAGGRRP